MEIEIRMENPKNENKKWEMKMKMKMNMACFIGERVVFFKNDSFVHWLGQILENWIDTCFCEKRHEYDKLSLRMI